MRRLARELGVDLRGVEGGGRKGRITKEDVRGDRRRRQAPAAPAPRPRAGAPAGLDLAPWPTVDFEKYGPIEREPLSRIKKISGPNLARNWVMIPHVTHNDEADITELEAFRKRSNEENAKAGVKMTMVALLLKASVAALKAYPQFNASLDGDDLVLKRYYHLGFAADTPGGLVVPVIRDVDQKGMLDIARELTELSGSAREGKLKADEMRGGTFTISSLGGIGGTSFTPIVNAPELAILGVTRSATKPVWNGSEFVPRLMLPLSLSYDHRVIDGARGRALHGLPRRRARRPAEGAALMADLVEVKVPDIGDFADVPVIEMLVSPGDTVGAEDPLVTLESDKATMDVPAPQAGTVGELKVSVGDKVSEGSVILMLDPAARGRVRRDGASRRRRGAPRPPKRPRRRPPSRRARRQAVRRPTPTSACRSSSSAPARAATPPRSAPPTSGSRSRSSTAASGSAASA